MPVQFITSCSAIVPGNGLKLPAGDTITAHSYVLLADSGTLTLAGQAIFQVEEKGPLGGTQWQRSSAPLAGHFPTLYIHVAPQVPATKKLQLHQTDGGVLVEAPASLPLLAQTYSICRDASNHPWSSGTGHSYWEVASAHMINQPACAGSNLILVQWKYAIGAVGYEVVQGQHGQYSGPHVP
jgi:hypothetical protein